MAPKFTTPSHFEFPLVVRDNVGRAIQIRPHYQGLKILTLPYLAMPEDKRIIPLMSGHRSHGHLILW